MGKVSIAVKTFGVCDFSRLAVMGLTLAALTLAALALVIFGADDSYPKTSHLQNQVMKVNLSLL